MDYASGVMPNPSSIHQNGVASKIKLENARKDVAKILSCRQSEVIFTSGGTEGNNIAIQGTLLAYTGKDTPHIITTNIEHSSVLETFKLLEKRKLAEVTFVPVESNGIVDPQKIRKALKKNTVLVSVMYANNEIGAIQPIREIAKEIRHFKKSNAKNYKLKTTSYPFFHTDAVQAVNYLDLNIERLGVDLLTLSGSKIEGSGRVGILYKKNNLQLSAVFGGGDQEFGLRPGTENLPAILEFRDAFLQTDKIKIKENARMLGLQKYFLLKIKNEKFIINGDEENRLPNNINITIPKIPSDLLVIELSARGIMVSSKSACKTGDGKASHVIQAINKNLNEQDGSIRFSFGRNTNKKDIDYTVNALKQILNKLAKWYI